MIQTQVQYITCRHEVHAFEQYMTLYKYHIDCSKFDMYKLKAYNHISFLWGVEELRGRQCNG